MLTQAVEDAGRRGERCIAAHAAIARAYVLFRTDATGALDETNKVAKDALAVFSELGDERGLAHSSRLLSLTNSWVSDWAAMGERLQTALEHVERTDDVRERLVILTWLAIAHYYGPSPVAEASRRTREIAELVKSDRVSHANTQSLSAALLAMQGRFREANELIASSVAVLEELDVRVRLGHIRSIAADVHLHAGRTQAAEEELRLAHATLDDVGDRAGAITVSLELADVLYDAGRYAEAGEWLMPVRDVLERSDVMTRVTGLAVQAKLLAQAGSSDEATAIARRAVDLADATDALTTRARVWSALAEVLRIDGETHEARDAFAEAIRLWEAKGDVSGAARARTLASNVPARA